MSKSTLLGAVALGVLLLASSPLRAADTAPKLPENVMKVLSSNKELSEFASLVSSTGVDKILTSKEGPVTVFAPTNAAMDKIPSDVLKKAKGEKDGMKGIAMHHLVTGSLVTSGSINGRRAGLASGAGESVALDGTTKGTMKVNNAVITTADLYAVNGVVHVINAPLIPPSLTAEKEKERVPETPVEPKDAKEKPVAKKDEAVKTEAKPVEAPATKVEPPAPAPTTEKKPEKKGFLKSFGF